MEKRRHQQGIIQTKKKDCNPNVKPFFRNQFEEIIIPLSCCLPCICYERKDTIVEEHQGQSQQPE